MIVALEGGDGCGKSSIAQWLVEEHGFVSLADPGGTPLSTHLRSLLLDKTEYDLRPPQLALLFLTATIDVMNRAVDLEAGGAKVVLDRTYLSNYAYRLAQGMALAHLKILHEMFLPQSNKLTSILYLRAPWRIRKARMQARADSGVDRFERLDDDFHIRVERSYDALAAKGEVVSIDAAADLVEVKRQVAAVLGLSVAP